MTIITDITTSRNKAYIINSDRYIDDVPPRLGVVSDSAKSPVGSCSEQPAAAGMFGRRGGHRYIGRNLLFDVSRDDMFCDACEYESCSCSDQSTGYDISQIMFAYEHTANGYH